MQKFLRFGIAAQIPLYNFEILAERFIKARIFDLFGLNTLPTTHIWISLCKGTSSSSSTQNYLSFAHSSQS
jgi:hypothetical protein